MMDHIISTIIYLSSRGVDGYERTVTTINLATLLPAIPIFSLFYWIHLGLNLDICHN